MRRAIAAVVHVTGRCNAGYRPDDKVVVNLDNACIDKKESDTLCIFAVSAILSSMSRIREGEEILASCPDPATGQGGNVSFKVVKEEFNDESAGRSK